MTRAQILSQASAEYAGLGLPAPATAMQWLPSQMFQRRYVDIDVAAAPVLPHSTPRLEDVPTTQHAALRAMAIILDQNVNHAGSAPNFAYVPTVIVVFGYAAFLYAVQSGQVAIWAWVGDEALGFVEAL